MGSRYPRLMYAVPVAAALAVTLAASGPPTTEGPAVRSISGRLDGGVSTVLIESSEPVAYLTSQPDPLTVFVDLRNARAEGLASQPLGDMQPPVSDVQVMRATAPDGAPVARVRVALARPSQHRVRASRNFIFVEVDRAAGAALASVAPTVLKAPTLLTAPASAPAANTQEVAAAAPRTTNAATRLTAVRPLALPGGTAIALSGNGRLVATKVEAVSDMPARVLLDFEGVAMGSVPSSTAINQGDVQRVRVAVNSSEPLITRVVIDLARKIPYTVETVGEELRVMFARATDAASSMVAAPAPSAAPAAPAPPAAPAAAVREETPVVTNADASPVVLPPAAPAPVVATAAPIAAPTAPAANSAAVMMSMAQTTSAPPQAAQPPVPAEPAAPRFSGHPVTFDFQGADLRAVLRTFAEISGLNLVIDPAIQGTVDVSLKDVPWDQALDIILKANKLGYTVDGTIVRIAPLTVLADEEAQRRKLTEAQALAGELRVMTRPLSYAKAADLVPIITKSALSQRGDVQVDARSNTLIIRDLADRLVAAGDLISTLDSPQPQVEIEARIVQTTRDFARSLGVQWGFNGRMDPALGNSPNLAFPNTIAVGGRQGSVQGPDATPTGVNLAAPAATSALGIALGSINGAINLDVALSALENTGKGRILSTPRVSTQNNVEAEITQGQQIPIQTQANNTITVTFKDAALTLRVLPQITAVGTVIMKHHHRERRG